METPPPRPSRESRRLGWKFLLILLTPLALFAVWLSPAPTFPLTDEEDNSFGSAAVISLPICATICAITVAKSGTPNASKYGLAALTFGGALVLYAGAAFAGCVLNFGSHTGRISP